MSFRTERRRDVAIEKRVEERRGFVVLFLFEGDADALHLHKFGELVRGVVGE